MIPERESLIVFEKYEKQQTQLGNHKGILLKNKQGNIQNCSSEIKSAIKKLTPYYKPHTIKNQNYWRWSFAIPIEFDDNHYVGLNLVVEWHRNSGIEYMTIETKRKTWEKGHLPPCLWD